MRKEITHNGEVIYTTRYLRAHGGQAPQTAEEWIAENDYNICWKHRHTQGPVKDCISCRAEYEEVAPREKWLRYIEEYGESNVSFNVDETARSVDWDIERLDLQEQQKRLLALLDEGNTRADVARLDDVTRAAITNRLTKIRKRLKKGAEDE